MQGKIISFLIYLLSGFIQITIIIFAEIIAELTFAKGAWVPAGIILFFPIYFAIFLLTNLILIFKKNKTLLKIIDIGFLIGIFIELSGLYTPIIFYLFGLTTGIHNESLLRIILQASW